MKITNEINVHAGTEKDAILGKLRNLKRYAIFEMIFSFLIIINIILIFAVPNLLTNSLRTQAPTLAENENTIVIDPFEIANYVLLVTYSLLISLAVLLFIYYIIVTIGIVLAKKYSKISKHFNSITMWMTLGFVLLSMANILAISHINHEIKYYLTGSKVKQKVALSMF